MADHIQIGAVSPRIQYAGNGVQAQFTYPFPIFQNGDVEVYENTTLKTLTADYAVTGAGNSGGGSVTFVTAPANGVTVTLRRKLTIQRNSDFQESGEFRAKVINDELDILTAGVQQINEDVGRCLRLAVTDHAASMEIPGKATRAGKFLAFDANGDPTAGDTAGPQGPQGPSGLDGKTVLGGSGVPADAMGANGDFYFDTTNHTYYGPKTAGSWPLPGVSLIGPSGSGNGDMIGANNLSDVANVTTARANLGLGSAATVNTGTAGANVPTIANADGRYLQKANNLSDVANAATARTNLGLGNAAVQDVAAGGTGALLRADGDGSQLTNLPGGGGKLVAVHRTIHAATSSLDPCVSGGSPLGSDLGAGSPAKVNIPTAGILRLTCEQADFSRISGVTYASVTIGLEVAGKKYFAVNVMAGSTSYSPVMVSDATGSSKIRGGYGPGYYMNIPTQISFDIAAAIALDGAVGMATGSQTVKVLMGDNAQASFSAEGQTDYTAFVPAVFVLEVIDGS